MFKVGIITAIVPVFERFAQLNLYQKKLFVK